MKIIKRILCSTILFACTNCTLQHLNGFPVILEDDTIIESGKAETNGLFYFTSYADDEAGGFWEVFADIRYGIKTDKLNLCVFIPLTHTWKEDNGSETTETGIGDISLFLKTKLYDNLYLMPGLMLPTGNENKELGEGKIAFSATAVYKLKLRRADIFLNCSVLFLNQPDASYGIAYNLPVSDRTDIVVETYGESGGSGTMLSAAPGLTYALKQDKLYIAASTQIPFFYSDNFTDDKFPYMPYIGITYEH
ncbi:MAG: hypothetical protein BWY26_01348 [Elusimicrobia bacterium ADurb.Bin231]|nr:MAG: hypothetical protein BWY26_01348 [Elusimicrobia bacterium ADurb.Bin231]